MKIAVLAGGLSSERNVSLATGTCVCRALRENGHKAILIDMFMGVQELPENTEELFNTPDGFCKNVGIAADAPDIDAVKRQRGDKSSSRLGPHVLEICQAADMVFLGLHGEDGEDGRIQAALDLLGVPYTGSGHLGSAIAMNKAVAKQIMDAEGIPNPAWKLVEYTHDDVDRLTKELPVPCVVKTISGGSSLGVYLPKDRDALREALDNLLQYDNKILVEERKYGREFTVAVLGDRWLPAAETVIAEGDFDYTAKYQIGGAMETCPADLTPEKMAEAGEMALRVHRALGLQVYSRTDMIMDKDGNFWCLEANSLPGMTTTSFLPKEAKASGLDYNQLCETIVKLSYQKKNG